MNYVDLNFANFGPGPVLRLFSGSRLRYFFHFALCLQSPEPVYCIRHTELTHSITTHFCSFFVFGQYVPVSSFFRDGAMRTTTNGASK